MWVTRDGRGRLHDLLVRGNRRLGARVDLASGPRFERCRFEGNRNGGLLVRRLSTPRFLDCRVTANEGHGLHDPTAMMYVLDEDLVYASSAETGRMVPVGLQPDTPIEPLILRANAGDCIRVTLRNELPETPPDVDGFNMFPMIVNRFNANQVHPSSQVGLHPQLVPHLAQRLELVLQDLSDLRHGLLRGVDRADGGGGAPGGSRRPASRPRMLP